MDSRQSYDEGKAGAPREAGTDINAYREGQAAASAAAFDASQQSGQSKRTSLPALRASAQIPPVAFTLLLVAPLLFIVYPVLGLTIVAVLGGSVLAARALPLPEMLELIVGFFLCVMSFFVGMKLEVAVTQFAPYRWLRLLWRVLNAFCWTLFLVTGADRRLSGSEVLDKVTPGGFLGAVAAAILVPLLFARLDRVYFPNRKQEKREAEQIAQGLGVKRPVVMRLLFAIIWLIPAMIVLNLLVRLGVEFTHSDPESVHAFYQRFGIIVEGCNLVVWLVLCIIGVLPGTGRYRTKPVAVAAPG